MDSITDVRSELQEVPPSTLEFADDFPIASDVRARDPRLHDQAQQQALDLDHEDEDEIRRRLEAWRSMAANLQDGFTQVPDQVRKDPTLSSNAKLVYEHLLGFMWQKEWCWPGQQRIADDIGISRRTVIRACQELYGRCYIEKWRRGLGKTNIYFINPLTFVQSFKKPRRGDDIMRTEGLLQVNAPELQTHVSSSPAPDVLLSLYAVKCQTVTSRSDKVSQQEAPDWHTKHTKREKDKEEKDRLSKGTNAEKGRGSRGLTIRTSEQQTKANERDETETNSTEASKPTAQTKTKITPSEKEHAAPPPPPSVQEPAAALQPNRRTIPDFIEANVETLSEAFSDNPRYIKSNVTRAAKLYFYAEDYLSAAQEDPIGWFFARVDGARHAALYDVGEIRKRTGSRPNRMPVFFDILEKSFKFTLEELVHVRTARLINRDYTLWDTINGLRVQYQEHYDAQLTQLDYRGWLQAVILDELEHCKAPKVRENETARDY